MPSGVYNHIRKYNWTPEMDAVVVEAYTEGLTYKEIAQKVNETFGLNMSHHTAVNRLKAMGVLSDYGKRPTQDMKDWAYVHREMPIRKLTTAFNEKFETDWSHMKIYRLLIDANAERGHVMTPKEFVEEWTKIHNKFAKDPDQVAPPHWLWRWKRFRRTTTSGVVYRGKAEKVPTFFTEEQFAREWRKMQKLFGIN